MIVKFNQYDSLKESWLDDKEVVTVIDSFFDKIVDWQTDESFNHPNEYGEIEDYKKCTVKFKDGQFSFFLPYFFRGIYRLERANGYGYVGDTREAFDTINNSPKKEKVLKQLYKRLKKYLSD